MANNIQLSRYQGDSNISSTRDIATETSARMNTEHTRRLETGSYISSRSVGSRSLGNSTILTGNKKIPPIYYIDNANQLNPSEEQWNEIVKKNIKQFN